MWLEHPSFKANFSSWWSMSVQGRWNGYHFMEKLRALKIKLRVWNNEVFGDIQVKMKEIIKRIEKIDAFELDVPSDGSLKGERDCLKEDFTEVIKNENISWNKKAKVKWAKVGACSTGFFYRAANGIDWSPISTREDLELAIPFSLEEIRKILDQALIANETLKDYRLKKDGVVLKLDFEKVEGNIIDSFGVDGNEVALSHLRFADDTVLSCLGNDFDKLRRWTDVFDFVVGTFPSSYLGNPLVFVERFVEGQGVKKEFFFKAGKLTLIWSVLSGIPIYYLSLFRAPSFVCKSIK
ncbi:hypothetical protein E5676_scaffold216G00550 [Cucumis melo var. makuwa]|uniref:Uncharacterized protein n=1 Tax=Cucumis melo var. makuwa TaxID=1194695 RepID=A0A5A7UQK0_CUCMM|nr:hypothetical protein E6C27_scaffold280G002530 [Cucumis melo var. makuwa]TYK30082.1 hypothetical protein E5676_scaffold216G00550 [Cucumis melo var. makuwa]